MKYLPSIMYSRAFWSIRTFKLQDLIDNTRYSIKECLKNGDKVYLQQYRDELNYFVYELKRAQYLAKVSKFQ